VVEESVGYEGRVGSNAFRESSEGLLKGFNRTEVGDEFRMKPRKKWGSRRKKRERRLTASEGAKMVRLPPWRRGRRVAALVVARLAKVVKLREDSKQIIPTSSVKVVLLQL